MCSSAKSTHSPGSAEPTSTETLYATAARPAALTDPTNSRVAACLVAAANRVAPDDVIGIGDVVVAPDDVLSGRRFDRVAPHDVVAVRPFGDVAPDDVV